jgi:hypothetical protein
VSKFTPTTKTASCPICEDVTGKCRVTDWGHLCMEYSSNADIPGFKFIGQTRNQLWGKWLEDQGDSTPEQQEQKRQERLREIEHRRQLEQKQRAASLPPEQRDRHYQRLLAQLGLHPDDRADLVRRGFTPEQIERFGARSVERWQKLSEALPADLPGVTLSEHSLNVSQAGYLCPIRDVDGHLVDFQLRARDAGKGGRYRWLSSNTKKRPNGPAPNLPNGELPLAVYRPAAAQAGTVAIVEGTGPKPFLTAERLQLVTIGAAGGQWASSPETLRYTLERLGAQTLLLYPDAGAIANDDVMRRCQALHELVQGWGYKLQVAWWGQKEKTAPDIDELTDLGQIQLISWAKFEALTEPPKHESKEVRQWLDEVAALAGLSEGADRAAIAAAFNRQHKLSGDAPEGTFPALSLPKQGRKLFVLDGQKMTRKTSQALRAAVADAKQKGRTGVVFAPTRVLARSLAKQLGIYTLDSWQATPEDKRTNPMWVALCPESPWKLTDKAFDVVILDEGNEDDHRAQSGELGNRPIESRRAIMAMLERASTAILAQDGVYRAVVQSLQRWGNFEPAEVEVIRRRRAATDITVKLYLDQRTDIEPWDGSRKEKAPAANEAFYSWFDGIPSALTAGKRVVISCGSEGQARAMHRVLRELFPEGKGQVIDGKYTPASIRREFADNPSEFAVNHGLDWLIYTPVFNSGVSIEGTYFDASFEYVRAFETASSASQRGERVRDVIRGEKIKQRHVYVASRGLPKMPDSEVFTADYWRDLLFSPEERPEAINLAQQMGCTNLITRIGQQQQQMAQECLELPELLAIQARELYFKVELLTQEWEGNGWEIMPAIVSPEAAKRWSGAFYQAREAITSQKARTLAKARPIEKQGDEVAGPIEATKHLKYELAQQIGQYYPGLKDAEWIESWVIAPGDSGLQSLRIRSLVRMAHEQPDLWASLAQQMTLATLAKAGGITEEPLPCTQKEFAIASLLKDAPGIYAAMTESGAVWTNKSPSVRAAGEWARANAQALAKLSRHQQRIHGLQFTPKTPDVKCFHKLLAMMGLESQCLGRQAADQRLWEYRLLVATDIEAKIKAKLAKDDERTHDLQRQAHRLRTDSDVYEALNQTLCDRTRHLAPQWEKAAAQILEKYAVQNFSEGKDLTTEVLDEPASYPLALWLKLGVQVALERLEGAIATIRYEGTRYYVGISDLKFT